LHYVGVIARRVFAIPILGIRALAVIAFVWIRVIKPAQPGAKRPCTEGRDDD